MELVNRCQPAGSVPYPVPLAAGAVDAGVVDGAVPDGAGGRVGEPAVLAGVLAAGGVVVPASANPGDLYFAGCAGEVAGCGAPSDQLAFTQAVKYPDLASAPEQANAC